MDRIVTGLITKVADEEVSGGRNRRRERPSISVTLPQRNLPLSRNFLNPVFRIWEDFSVYARELID